MRLSSFHSDYDNDSRLWTIDYRLHTIHYDYDSDSVWLWLWLDWTLCRTTIHRWSPVPGIWTAFATWLCLFDVDCCLLWALDSRLRWTDGTKADGDLTKTCKNYMSVQMCMWDETEPCHMNGEGNEMTPTPTPTPTLTHFQFWILNFDFWLLSHVPLFLDNIVDQSCEIESEYCLVKVQFHGFMDWARGHVD